MAFSQGSITATLTAKISDFQNKMKRAEASLSDFGSKGKQLQDKLDDLSRRKEILIEKMEAIDSGGKKNSNTYKNLELRVAKYSDNIDTHNMRISEFIKKNSGAGSSMQGLSDNFRKLSRLAGGFNSFIRDTLVVTLGNLLADAMSNVIQLSKEMATNFFNAGIKTEQQAIAFEVLTGSVQEGARLMEEINNFSVDTPFDIGQVRDVTKQLLAFDISSKDVIPTLSMLGDITAGTGGQLDLLARAYAQTKSKGKLYAQEINQFAEQGVGLRDVLASLKGVGIQDFMQRLNSGGANEIVVTFDDMNKALKELHKNKFIGLLTRQADTAGGRIKNLQESISLVGQRILGIDTETGKIKIGSIFDKISKGVEKMLDFLTQNEDKIVEIATSGIDKTFEAIGKSIDFIASLKDDFDSVMNAFKSTMQWTTDNQDMLLSGLSTITGAIAGGWVGANFALITSIVTGVIPALLALIPTLIAATLPIFPFILAGLAIGAVIGGVILIVKNWGTITDWVSKKISAIPQLTAKTVGYIVGYVIGTLVKSIAWLYQKFLDLMNFFGTLPQRALSLFVGLILAVRRFRTRIIEEITNIIKGVTEYDYGQLGKDIMNGLWNGLKDKGGEILQWSKDFANGIGDGFKDALGIQSPSKLFEYFGKMIVGGLKVGIEENTGGVGAASQKMMQAVTNNSINNTNNNQRYINVYNFGNSRNSNQVNPNFALA